MRIPVLSAGSTVSEAVLRPEALFSTVAISSIESPCLNPTAAHSYVMRRLHAATAEVRSLAA